MATHRNLTARYDAPADRVWAMLVDPEYLAATVDGAQGTWSVEEVDGTCVVTASRTLADLPAAARNILGASALLTERQEWGSAQPDGSRSGTISITVAGAPATVAGTLRLVPEGASCHVAIEVDITVAIPLFGGAAEGMVATQLESVVQRQQEIGTAWLTSH